MVVDPLRSSAVRGTEAPSRLGRTWFLQARDIAAVQERTGVSVRLIIVNTTLPEWQISYENTSKVLKPQSLLVCNLHDWISFDGTSPKLESTPQLLVLVDFCTPNPRPCVDPGPHYLYDLIFL